MWDTITGWWHDLWTPSPEAPAPAAPAPAAPAQGGDPQVDGLNKATQLMCPWIPPSDHPSGQQATADYATCVATQVAIQQQQQQQQQLMQPPAPSPYGDAYNPN